MRDNEKKRQGDRHPEQGLHAVTHPLSQLGIMGIHMCT